MYIHIFLPDIQFFQLSLFVFLLFMFPSYKKMVLTLAYKWPLDSAQFT